MWAEDEPIFEGEFFRIDGASAPPLPSVPPPICIGASGEKIGLPLAARHADIWNTVWRGSNDSLIRKRNVVLAELDRLGRSRSDIEFSLTIEKALPNDGPECAQFVELLSELIELGINHFVLDFGNPQSPAEADRFITDVMTPLRS